MHALHAVERGPYAVGKNYLARCVDVSVLTGLRNVVAYACRPSRKRIGIMRIAQAFFEYSKPATRVSASKVLLSLNRPAALRERRTNLRFSYPQSYYPTTFQSPSILVALHLALIDADDLVEHVERLVAWALDGVAADDLAVGAAVAQAADLGEQAFEVPGLAAGEHHDAPSVDDRLPDVLDARGERRDVDVGLLVGGLGLWPPQDVVRRLCPDDVGSEQGGHV